MWRPNSRDIVQHFLAQQWDERRLPFYRRTIPSLPQCRQLQRWPDRVDPKTEAEQVHLKTLAGGEQDTEEPIER